MRAIEVLKVANDTKYTCNYYTIEDLKAIDTVLKLVENQQKEIEELKIYKDYESYNKVLVEHNYIPKSKIEKSYLNMEKEYSRKVYDNNYDRTEVKKEEMYKRQVYEEILEGK